MFDALREDKAQANHLLAYLQPGFFHRNFGSSAVDRGRENTGSSVEGSLESQP
jgi:hypothetical protein